jgi:hypothetical protein
MGAAPHKKGCKERLQKEGKLLRRCTEAIIAFFVVVAAGEAVAGWAAIITEAGASLAGGLWGAALEAAAAVVGVALAVVTATVAGFGAL